MKEIFVSGHFFSGDPWPWAMVSLLLPALYLVAALGFRCFRRRRGRRIYRKALADWRTKMHDFRGLTPAPPARLMRSFYE